MAVLSYFLSEFTKPLLASANLSYLDNSKLGFLWKMSSWVSLSTSVKPRAALATAAVFSPPAAAWSCFRRCCWWGPLSCDVMSSKRQQHQQLWRNFVAGVGEGELSSFGCLLSPVLSTSENKNRNWIAFWASSCLMKPIIEANIYINCCFPMVFHSDALCAKTCVLSLELGTGV